ncbi:hypothetical protein NOR_05370 [Metarhizium rileyi]|uniref:Extracellular membrane protein CFEM domain-containing protein n=1 Tax=Metarhizium rileyi (strain RCEF 4871) TaxID=1649241 RepID=A0A167CKB0_METRR|nr:hypothetical protein NOR_05370 [Metarhizium rileyi RCEF 4871]TWU74042.1 hypothetical protein ED733_002521 [Metarhizium rileyi]
MKFVAAALLALSVSAQGANVAKRQDKGQVSCSVPCIDQATQTVFCNKDLYDCFCTSAADVKQKSSDCVSKCGLGANEQTEILSGAKELCSGTGGTPAGEGDTACNVKCLDVAKTIACGGASLKECICKNFEALQKEVLPCLQKCGTDTSNQAEVSLGVGNLCSEKAGK